MACEQYRIDDLDFSYLGTDSKALDGVNLTIHPGEYLVFCGKSGCGKTTLLRHLKTALTPYGVGRGRVLFCGRPLDEVPTREQASSIGFVMQNPDAQVVTDKVWHELAYGLESLGCDERTMRLRVAEMASYFGIQEWFHRNVRSLSGGQKQLLNLASIMAMQPLVLILDEPTSQLDPIAASDFLNTIRKINLELGTTILLSEHRLEEVVPVADRVVYMEAGRIRACAPPRDIGDYVEGQGDPLMASLPAPMRIYYAWADKNLPCPLTVREGRNWLSQSVPAIEDEAPDEGLKERSRPAARKGQNKLGKGPVPNGAEAAVIAKELWFRYGKEDRDILKGVDLAIPRACIHGIMGGNGAGKSTLLKALCGVVRSYRGTVRILGRKLKEWPDDQLFRGGVALLPQDPQNIFVKKTVQEDLLEMLAGSPLSKDERQRAVDDMVAFMGIGHLLQSHPYDLSGGEQQRAALAKVLLTKPQILLLDEPTKGVDNAFKEKLGTLFRKLTEQGITVVMSSHDVEFCARYADSLSLFFDGAVVCTDVPRRFFSQNSFYTTAANRMSRHLVPDAIVDEDVVALRSQVRAAVQGEARP